MTVEDRLRRALRSTDAYQPSPDLFVKVQRSIEEDRAHRRRVRANAAIAAAFVLGLVAWFAVWWDPRPEVSPVPWWSVVAAVVAVQSAIVAVVGPAIRRFGRTYVDDVFRSGPETGSRFLALLDVAYYLVFAGYVLAVTPLDVEPGWRAAAGFAELVQYELAVTGGLILLMGVLHAVTVFVLPFAGLVFMSTRHRTARPDRATWSAEVRRAHRTVTVVLIVVAVVFVSQLLGVILALVGAGFDAFGG